MHIPLSSAMFQEPESSTFPESSWVLPESSAVTDESEPPLEDPLLEELPLEEPLLEEPPLEEPPLDIAPPESAPPPEAPSGAAPSFDSIGFKAPGALVVHAGTKGAVTSAKPQMRTDRAFMFGGHAIPMPCSRKPEIPDDLGVPSGGGAARYVAPASGRAGTPMRSSGGSSG